MREGGGLAAGAGGAAGGCRGRCRRQNRRDSVTVSMGMVSGPRGWHPVSGWGDQVDGGLFSATGESK